MEKLTNLETMGADDIDGAAPSSGLALSNWIRKHFGAAATIFGPYEMFSGPMANLVDGLDLDPDNPVVDLWIGVSAAKTDVSPSAVDLVGGYWPHGTPLLSGQVYPGKTGVFRNVPVDLAQSLIVASSDPSRAVHVAAQVPDGEPPFRMGDPNSGGLSTDDTLGDELKKKLPDVLGAGLSTSIWVVGLLVLAVILLVQAERGKLIPGKA